VTLHSQAKTAREASGTPAGFGGFNYFIHLYYVCMRSIRLIIQL